MLRVGRGRGARSSHKGWCNGTQRARALRGVSEGRARLSAPEKKPFQSPRKPSHEGIVLGKGKPGNRLVPRVSGAFTRGFVVLQETLPFQKLINPTFRASFQCSRVPAVFPRGRSNLGLALNPATGESSGRRGLPGGCSSPLLSKAAPTRCLHVPGSHRAGLFSIGKVGGAGV